MDREVIVRERSRDATEARQLLEAVDVRAHRDDVGLRHRHARLVDVRLRAVLIEVLLRRETLFRRSM